MVGSEGSEEMYRGSEIVVMKDEKVEDKVVIRGRRKKEME